MAEKPEQKFNIGLVKATVWKNVSKDGNEFKTVSLNRSYQKDGEWKNTNSLGVNDIDKAIQVLEQARDFVNGSEPAGEAGGQY
ncbi:MAG: hypothetical protein KKC75_03760 [Nanoarchaeota archaeon]|nr:hypothetical protein [Nanoarchaeota archaeon]MBU1005645.1 hypothetical protein [Nanoarchaeota archaeon]MBU1945814.1 hypothetical protein [Nanoarchaeota archaeon]